VDSGGEKYLEMHRRLVAYFDRKNCLSADTLADETLARVAQKLHEKGQIIDLAPAHYCYVTAKFVFLEHLRHAKRGEVPLDNLRTANQSSAALAATPVFDLAGDQKERLLANLDSCLEKLSAADRDLILAYYQGDGQDKIQKRRHLGESLGLSANALSIRACRIRAKVEECVKQSRKK